MPVIFSSTLVFCWESFHAYNREIWAQHMAGAIEVRGFSHQGEFPEAMSFGLRKVLDSILPNVSLCRSLWFAQWCYMLDQVSTFSSFLADFKNICTLKVLPIIWIRYSRDKQIILCATRIQMQGCDCFSMVHIQIWRTFWGVSERRWISCRKSSERRDYDCLFWDKTALCSSGLSYWYTFLSLQNIGIIGLKQHVL